MPLLHTISLPTLCSPASIVKLEAGFVKRPSIPAALTSVGPRRRGCCSCSAVSRNSDSESASASSSKSKSKASSKEAASAEQDEDIFVPRKPRRGRRSEAAAVEDFVRDHLKRTFASIRKQEQDPEFLEKMKNLMKDGEGNLDSQFTDIDGGDEEEEEGIDGEENKSKKRTMVEEEDPDWPLDADVGWGIRASDYFEQHPIKNVAGEDGFEIDWEGELDEGWVQEINCLEWESIAFHPSPLIVLVFERYNRASDNWKTLKELEKAAKVYWSAKDRLPPRTVKIDLNIEKDLAYALKARECPQILFLRGQKVVYREKEFRTAEELVQMIAHFYYNAKKPSCVKDLSYDAGKD